MCICGGGHWHGYSCSHCVQVYKDRRITWRVGSSFPLVNAAIHLSPGSRLLFTLNRLADPRDWFLTAHLRVYFALVFLPKTAKGQAWRTMVSGGNQILMLSNQWVTNGFPLYILVVETKSKKNNILWHMKIIWNSHVIVRKISYVPSSAA